MNTLSAISASTKENYKFWTERMQLHMACYKYAKRCNFEAEAKLQMQNFKKAVISRVNKEYYNSINARRI